VAHGARLLWLKMRPDTPQHYEYISVEDVEGEVDHFLSSPVDAVLRPAGRTDMPVSVAEHVSMRRCKVKCREFFNVGANPDQYRLSHFTFQDLTIQARNPQLDTRVVEDMTVENCDIRTP
jgi:hypothetical protein